VSVRLWGFNVCGQFLIYYNYLVSIRSLLNELARLIETSEYVQGESNFFFIEKKLVVMSPCRAEIFFLLIHCSRVWLVISHN
jgi:hypothetical protein